MLESLQSSRLHPGSSFLFFGSDLYLLAVPLINVIIELLLVLWFFPILFFVLDGCLQIGVYFWFFDFGLSLLDKEGQLVVELVNELEHIEEFCAFGLDGP